MWNIKPGQLVEIHWVDPCAASHWVDADKISVCSEFIIQSVGWVHLTDDVGVVLTASLEVGGDEQLLLRQHLPWGCIHEVWILSGD